jgi:hypothetical protein
MSEYNPDKWVMLKFTHNGKEIYKILATFYGGYTTGDSWKLNSGVTKIEEDGQMYRFHGSSGSVYQVHKATYGMGSYTMGVFRSFERQVEDANDPSITMELMPAETNFMEIHYE